MERVHYRRYKPSSFTAEGNYGNEEEPGVLGETLILQGIVSGVILVIVMVVSMLTVAPLNPVQEALQQALSGPVTPAELASETSRFGVDTLGLTFLERFITAP